MSNIFGGGRFFLSRAIPQRTQLKEQIQKHGGSVVLLEKDADIILVDHLRKTQTHPPNALSYQYIEQSVRHGRLEDPASHRVHPAAARPMGASNIPKKSTRRSYTLEDDRIVFDWLYPHEQAKNQPTHGNAIYQSLAQRFPHHTWQSWRSRYLKALRGKPRPGGGVPRPDLVYGGPEAVPRFGPLTQGPQPPIHSPTSTAPPAQSASGPSKQPRPPAESNTKRGPPHNSSPHSTQDASPAKKRRIGVPEQFPATTRPAPNQPQQTVTQPLRTPPREPLGQHTDTSLPEPSTAHHQISAIPAQGTTTTETDGVAKDTVDMLFRHLPFFPTSSEAESEDDDEEEEYDDGEDSDPEDYSDISSWVQAQVTRGADVSLVLDALRYTSMEPALARKLLKILMAGSPVPENMRGVWTKDDDRCLESLSARDVERVLKKHGDRLFNARWEYLEMARERGIIQ